MNANYKYVGVLLAKGNFLRIQWGAEQSDNWILYCGTGT